MRFDPRYADAVADWVGSTEELHRLAPSTKPPLTAAKVIRWPQPGGRAFILLDREGGEPVAYGELNPMRNTADQYWLGHVIVSPAHRGQGLGEFFVLQLVTYARDSLCATKLSLVVFPENDAAIGCYLGVGFTNKGEEFHQFNGVGPKHRLLRFEMEPGGR